jgi:hypothetical protein
MNPEWSAINSVDRRRERREELSPIMNKAYEKAQSEVLTNPEYVIQESEFCQGDRPVYSPQEVASDLAYADRVEKDFESSKSEHGRNSKKIGETFEAMMLMQSEMANWLGNATTMKTARYDDYKNKIDMISEWHSPESGSQILSLAVDVTFGASTIAKKMYSIKEEIDRGELGLIRYFKDSRGDFMGTRRNVPRTVVGISQPVVEELAGLWVNNENRKLGDHPVQRVITGQIYSQLLAMRNYAMARENHVATQSYEQALAIIKRVRERGSTTPTTALSEDPVWREISAQTKMQFQV